jgi:phosphatidylglycerophosphatase A
MPIVPGTFGSVVGVLWFALLMAAGTPWLFLAGTLAGLALSVWLCGLGERLLGKTDPGSVVLDEIAAMPVCFGAWIGILASRAGGWPQVADFFSGNRWALTLGVFTAFRLFDGLKPWPVYQSQSLPRGWGITTDDFLAALYVNLVVLVVWAFRGWLGYQ